MSETKHIESELETKSDVMPFEKDMIVMNEKKRRTTPYITKYEKTRVLSMRAQQLENGAPSTVHHNFDNTRAIIKKEWDEKAIPLIVRRYFPNGEHEDCPVHDLIEL